MTMKQRASPCQFVSACVAKPPPPPKGQPCRYAQGRGLTSCTLVTMSYNSCCIAAPGIRQYLASRGCSIAIPDNRIEGMATGSNVKYSPPLYPRPR